MPADHDESGFAAIRTGRVKRYSEREYAPRGRFGSREAADTAGLAGLLALAATMAYGAELVADTIEDGDHSNMLFGGPVENFAAFALMLRIGSFFLRSGGDTWFANTCVWLWDIITRPFKRAQ